MREDCWGKEREKGREGRKQRKRGVRRGGENKCINTAFHNQYGTGSEPPNTWQGCKPLFIPPDLRHALAHPGGPSLAPGQFAGVCAEMDGIGISLDILGK